LANDAWLTPDTPGPGFICRPLFIPNGQDWLAIVTGALNELIYTYNFEQYGTESVDDTVDIFRTMFDHFCFNDETGCRMIGEIVTFAGSTSPSPNWLACDGASLLRTDYPDLFMVIGTTYGSVDGTHFNLPDLSGRVVLGVGSGSGLSTYTLGQSGGEETHQLTVGELASHTHSDVGHSHTEGSSAPTVVTAGAGAPVPSAVPSIGVTGTGNANITSTGSDTPHNNIQPFLALNYFIVAQ